MRDEISSGEDLRNRMDGELSTVDFAGRGEAAPRTIDVKPLLANEPPRLERAGADVTAGAGPGELRGAAIHAGGVHGAASAPALEQEMGPLFSGNEANTLRAQWDAIQVGFVDEPRGAVQQADNLVAGTMKRLAEIFANERGNLEGQWGKGENVSTEELRLALRRYRSFFGRLLSV
jgi:hypothetical protein